MNNEAPKVHIVEYFASSPETIYDAWLRPAIIKKWLFVSDTSEIVKADIDARPGGRFSIVELNNEKYIDHYGRYEELIHPTKLFFSLEVPDHFPGVTYVTVLINPEPKGSKLTLIQTGVAPEVTEANWRTMLKQLTLVVDVQ